MVSPRSKARLTSVRGQDFEHESTPNGHPAFTVSNLPKSGVLSLQGLLPVSGHVRTHHEGKYLTKNETSDLFAKTNRYDVSVIHPDGTGEHIRDIPSQGLVTGVALGIKLQKGTTFVKFAPQGSFGVGGYSNGRTVELQYDGTK